MLQDERNDGAGAMPGGREVQLAIMVPPHVKRAVRRQAEADGLTLRGLLLRVLKQAGIVDVDDDDIVDRRAVAAQLRTRSCRDAAGR